MYLGHLGVAWAAKGSRPSLPIWLLIVAALGPDWIEIGCMASGVHNTSLPSHGLIGALIGCAVVTGVAFIVTRSRRDSALIAAVFASHIILDYVTGRKPVLAGMPPFGLYWYGHPVWDFTAEAAVLIVGWLWYQHQCVPRDRRSRIVSALLLATLLAVQAFFDMKFAGKPAG